jgi:hypothetical protein
VPPSVVVLFDPEKPRTLRAAQLDHHNFLVRRATEAVKKLAQRIDVREKRSWSGSLEPLESTAPS